MGSGGGVEMRTRCNLGNYFMISFPWLVPKYLFIFPSPLSPPHLLPCPYTITTLRDMHTLLKCKQTKFILTNESLDWFFSCYFMIQNNKQRSCYKYLSDPLTASCVNGHTHKSTQGHVDCWTAHLKYAIQSAQHRAWHTNPNISLLLVSLGQPQPWSCD